MLADVNGRAHINPRSQQRIRDVRGRFKILVAVFNSEVVAFEGLSALKGLHKDGDVTVYATAVLVKDASGNVSLKQTAENAPSTRWSASSTVTR
jgi:hypothetical protein